MATKFNIGVDIKIPVLVVGTIAALAVGFGAYFTVEPNQVAVVTRLGAIKRSEGPGGHLKMPFVDEVKYFRIDIDDVAPDKAVNTYTVDNQEVDILFNVFYRLTPDRVEYVYQNVPDYRLRLYTMAVDRLKAEMGKVNVQEVAEKRGELRDRIKVVLQRDAKSLGIEVTGFQLTNLEYDRRFRDAVANAAVQKANVEGFEYQRQQAEKQAESDKIKAIGQANAVRENARGTADAALLQATAEAKAIQIKGEAQATAMKAQADALKANPDLVNMRKAERWDGRLPQQMLGSAPMPFMAIEGRQ